MIYKCHSICTLAMCPTGFSYFLLGNDYLHADCYPLFCPLRGCIFIKHLFTLAYVEEFFDFHTLFLYIPKEVNSIDYFIPKS